MAEVVIHVSESDELPTTMTPPLVKSDSIEESNAGLRGDSTYRQHTPEHAVQNFDGTFNVIHARNVRTRKCDKNCLNFWFLGGLMIAITLVSIALIAVQGLDSTQGRFWQTMLSFAIGVVVPNPKYQTLTNNNDE